MEKLLLQEALKLDKPVFGIAGDCSSSNGYLGGTLYQDLETEYPASEHAQIYSPMLSLRVLLFVVSHALKQSHLFSILKCLGLLLHKQSAHTPGMQRASRYQSRLCFWACAQNALSSAIGAFTNK